MRRHLTTSTESHRHFPLYFGAVLLVLLLIALHLLSGVTLLAPTPYDTYTRQAMAWRSGALHLSEDVPHLELAIFEGRYYVSFPPVPSLVLLPLTFLFGDAVPDALLMMLYALVMYFALVRLSLGRGHSPAASALHSVLFVSGSSLLPMLMTGAVWYHAQVLALVLTVLAVEQMSANSPTIALVLYALAVGCRPFNALYGPLLMLMYLCAEHSTGKQLWTRVRSLLPGVLLGLLIAFLYGWYNFARFGNVFEFGHNYLPEFSFQGGKQFSFSHIGENIRTFLFGVPLANENGTLHLQRFGFSLLIANPAFLGLFSWALFDAFKRHISWKQAIILLVYAVHLLLLLSHRTFGGFQYGARYAVDCLPYVLLYWLYRPRQNTSSPMMLGLLALGTVLAVWGSLTISLPG